MTLFRHTRIAFSGFIILAPVGGALAQARPMTMAGMQMGDTSSAPLGISMERMGSGTTWIPDAVSVPARHFMAGSWELMLHGVAFAQYITQGGPRGDDQFGSLNWGMFMASRELAGGRFQARAMLSLDPATVTRRGYPLLLQSGEALDGEPLRDRQHPHDFWMELGLLYERPISDKFGVTLYAAPSGEPLHWDTTGRMRRTSPSASSPPASSRARGSWKVRCSTAGSLTTSAGTSTGSSSIHIPGA
jgi:hypothetical protein